MRVETGWSWRNSGVGGFVSLGVLLLAPVSSQADFITAFQAYKDKDYARAHAEFHEMALLGESASQYNLGAMKWLGQGSEKDPAEALGWMRAAIDNGYTVSPALIDKVRAATPPEHMARADAIVARYGRSAMQATLLPAPGQGCPGWEGGRVVHARKATFPITSDTDGFVLLEFTIGLDGLARDVEVVTSEPAQQFDAAAKDSIYFSRFETFRFEGKPTERRTQVLLSFNLIPVTSYDDSMWNMRAVKKVKAYADAGHPTAQYVIGAMAFADEAFRMPRQDAARMVVAAAQGGNVDAQYWVSNYLDRFENCRPGKAQPWLEIAARKGHEGARLMLADLLLRNPQPAEVERARELLSGIARTTDAYILRHAVAFLAGSPQAGVRDPVLALKLARRISFSRSPVDPQMREAVALALAANGDMKAAARDQERAIKQAKKLYWNTSLMEERLQAYQQGKHWTGDLFVVPPAISIPPFKGETAEVVHEEEED